jgi:hypothetical protein
MQNQTQNTADSKLTRTRAALAEFDRIGERMDAATSDMSADELNKLADRYATAQAAIGDAFYLDTADRNFPECAAFSRCPAGLRFMRECCERAELKKTENK